MSVDQALELSQHADLSGEVLKVDFGADDALMVIDDRELGHASERSAWRRCRRLASRRFTRASRARRLTVMVALKRLDIGGNPFDANRPNNRRLVPPCCELWSGGRRVTLKSDVPRKFRTRTLDLYSDVRRQLQPPFGLL